MRFGLQHPVGDPAWVPEVLGPEALRDFATRSEGAGFDLLAVTDHPAPSTRWVEAGGEGAADLFSSLGFFAALTTRVRLLPFVMVAGYGNGATQETIDWFGVEVLSPLRSGRG